MTLGILVPLAFLAIALVEIAIFRKWRADGLVSERAATIMTASSLAIPAIGVLAICPRLPRYRGDAAILTRKGVTA